MLPGSAVSFENPHGPAWCWSPIGLNITLGIDLHPHSKEMRRFKKISLMRCKEKHWYMALNYFAQSQVKRWAPVTHMIS
jgi:hypothetical protein